MCNNNFCKNCGDKTVFYILKFKPDLYKIAQFAEFSKINS